MTPFLAVVRTSTPNPKAAARLAATGRKLAEVLRRSAPSGVKVTQRLHQGALVLVTSAKREFSDAERSAMTDALRHECDRLWDAGTMRVDSYTRETMPASLA